MHRITVSAIMLILLLVSILMSAFQVHRVKAEHISPSLLETIYVDTTNPNLVWSNTILGKGLHYIIEVSGEYLFDLPGTASVADVEYSSRNNWITVTKEYVYTDTGEVFPHVQDLLVNEMNVDWGEYSTSHVYSINFLGTGTPISLVISDWYGEGPYPHPGAANNGRVDDNQGMLTVRIYLAARVKGIDTKNDIDWTGIYDKGYDFAFVKATEGINWPDPNSPDANIRLIAQGVMQRIANALAAGLLVGVYHFGRPVPNSDGAKAEAESFVRLAAPYLMDGYLRPFLDVEDNDYGEHPEVLGKEPLAQWIKDWMDTVEEKTCVRPILYMNPSLFEFLSDSSIVDHYDTWVYDVRDTEPATDDLPNTKGWRTWTFWQYRLDVAFGSKVADLDLFNGDETALREFIIARSDLDNDGKVNIQDIALVARAWGRGASDPNWNRATDLDNDGVIDIVDISRVAKKFGWLVWSTKTMMWAQTDDFSTDSGLWKYVTSAVNIDTGQGHQGSAYRDSSAKYLVLTENKNYQAGVVWYLQDVFSPFTMEFKYKAGGGSGADGLVFMFYKKKDYTPYDGGGLGFVSPPGGNSATAVPGYGVEFDNYQNTDPSGNHIALIKDNVSNHLQYANDQRTEDNQWHLVKIEVGGSSIKVYVDEGIVLAWEGVISRTYGGFGFSASTGSRNNWHLIDDVTFTSHLT